MGKIICGLKTYKVMDIPDNAEYHISLPRKTNSELELGIMQDFASLLVRGYKLIKGKEAPKELKVDWIKWEIIERINNNSKLQKEYLKTTRLFWEEKYILEELIWFRDFKDCISEISGKVGNNWYVMYQVIMGELPMNFPPDINFSEMINNVLYRFSLKYKNKIIEDYLELHPESIELLKSGEVPIDLILYPEIDLTLESYTKWIKD